MPSSFNIPCSLFPPLRACSVLTSARDYGWRGYRGSLDRFCQRDPIDANRSLSLKVTSNR